MLLPADYLIFIIETWKKHRHDNLVFKRDSGHPTKHAFGGDRVVGVVRVIGLFPNQIIKIGQHTKFQLKAFGSYPIMKVGYLRGCQVDWYSGWSGLNLPPGILKDN